MVLLSATFAGPGDRDTYWRNTGEYFGFPPCCVEAFLAGKCVPSSFDGTGFRTCAACAALPPAEVLAGIASRRRHPEPFPCSRGFTEAVRATLYG